MFAIRVSETEINSASVPKSLVQGRVGCDRAREYKGDDVALMSV